MRELPHFSSRLLTPAIAHRPLENFHTSQVARYRGPEPLANAMTL